MYCEASQNGRLILNLRDEEFKVLNDRENCKNIDKNKDNIAQWVATQNIDACLQKADMYIENKADSSKIFSGLTYNLIKLISLVKYPGCIPPSKDERIMQVAMTARQMSGCISRQVGACIADSRGYVVGIGWNDPPAGQVPCSLRTGEELCLGTTNNIFSEYERSAGFVEHIKNHCNIDKPFCFRSEYSQIKSSNRKSQKEFTRALHAEENAFYQALGHCGNKLSGFTLYTTDRTCTLCAKKAYQLGISRIVYINEYTDDAIVQTLRGGNKKIVVDRFQGIVGSAFFKLFSTLLPEKDIITLY